MNRELRIVVTGRATERLLINQLAEAIEEGGVFGLDRHPRQIGLKAKRGEFLGGMRQEVDPNTDRADFGCGFEDAAGNFGRVQRKPERQSANAGADHILTNHHCTGVEQDDDGVTLHFATGNSVRGRAAIACDGINSVIRKQFFPDEGEPRYSGVNMWRGVTRWQPILSGASLTRAGWLSHGKMVIYPIREAGSDGLQLVNWVAEIETPIYRRRDWNRAGSLTDFIGAFADWHFDWLDVPAFIRAADHVLEFPMVDQDPLPRWSFGRVTLLGDAAHPMVPRGSNGAGQAILDTRAMTSALLANEDPVAAFATYEKQRLEATTRVVLTNRTNPPDAILREVFQRTNDRPFKAIGDVISHDELVALSDSYKQIAGFSKEALRA